MDLGKGFLLLLGAELFERQEAKGEHHQGGVVVEAAPASALEVVEAEFLLHLLVALLDLPTLAPEPHRLEPGGAWRQVAKSELDGAIGLFLDEQPEGFLVGAATGGQPWAGHTRRHAKRPAIGPLAPSRQVTLRSGVRATTSRRLKGRGLPAARRW